MLYKGVLQLKRCRISVISSDIKLSQRDVVEHWLTNYSFCVSFFFWGMELHVLVYVLLCKCNPISLYHLFLLVPSAYLSFLLLFVKFFRTDVDLRGRVRYGLKTFLILVFRKLSVYFVILCQLLLFCTVILDLL